MAIVPLYEWWSHGLPVLRFVGHGPSDQLGPVSAPLSEPAAAAAVGEAIAAVPLPRFVLLAEHVAGDQRFGEVTGCSIPLQGGESGTALRARTRGTSSCGSAGATSANRCVAFRASLPSSGRSRTASPPTPSGSSRTLTLCSVCTGSVGAAPLPPFLLAEPFHREFAAQALRRGWLRLWFLEIDGKPVAALYGFRFAGAESAYQAGRDPAFGSSRSASCFSRMPCARR